MSRTYDIPGLSGYYIDSRGRIISRHTGQPVAPFDRHNGSPSVQLYRDDHRKTTRTIKSLQPKCLYCGCPNPRIPGDDYGLCETHRRAADNREYLYPYDLEQREFPIEESQRIIDEFITMMKLPDKIARSTRSLAREMKLGKDLIWHVKRGTFDHVRSEAFEELNESLANAIWEARIRPKCSNNRPGKR